MAPSSSRHLLDALVLILLLAGIGLYGFRQWTVVRDKPDVDELLETLVTLPERDSVDEILDGPESVPEPEPIPDAPPPPPPPAQEPEPIPEPLPAPIETPEAAPEPVVLEPLEEIDTTGIWIQSRSDQKPVRIEDSVSVNAEQLSQMAKIRNLSSDPRYPAPEFDITATGQGRLGTYVMTHGRMVEINSQIPSPQSPPRAWRLDRVTQTEVIWTPVE